MNRFQRVWNRLAAPCATDPDDARHEHMTRVILLMQAAALTVFTIPIVVGWIAGAFPLEAAIIMLSLLVPTIAGFWWAHHGRWKTARHIPPILFTALAVYLSFTVPLGLTPLLLLILAVMLTSMLHGSRTYWLVLGFTLAAYVGIGISSSQESAQWIIEALIIIGGSIAGLALLQWFSTSQFRNAIHNLQTQIAERGRTDEALRESEEKFRTFAELLPEVVFECDAQGNLSFVNESAFDKFGYTREDFEGGVNAGQFIAPSDRERMAKGIEKALRGVGEDSAEYVAQRRDDSEFPVIVFSSPIVHDGKPVGLRGIIVDITERKQAEEALRESEDRLSKTMLAANDGMWDWDLRTNEVYFDPRYYAMIGYAVDEFPHRLEEFQKRVHSDDLDAVMDQAQKHLNGEIERFIVEFRIQQKDGRWLWVLGRGVIVERDEAGVPLRFVGTHTDITGPKQAEEEREKLQAQLNQAQKMESVGRLAGGVAHDFNNMLGVILGHTEMALVEVDPAGPLFAGLQEVRKAAEHSVNLTRQLLAFARKQTVAPKVLNLNETIEGMLKMLRRLIGEDVNLAWVPETRVWPVKMDPSQIDQVLANLCVNAREAITDVGKVTIETQNASFDETHCAHHPGFVPGEYVLLAISDDGCGMDKETLRNLFEPFFTTKETGTGLGLATVYGIVKQNSGFINVYSEPGDGTTFKVYLPRHMGAAEQVRMESPVDPANQGHETILLVEDEPAILKLTTAMLESQGYTVLAASMPGEAIRLAAEHAGRIHLLMTDVVMPEMNGRELAKNLLSLYPDLKRLFMSGYTANVIAHRGVIDEGVNFIQKPFAIQDLAAKVREVLDGE